MGGGGLVSYVAASGITKVKRIAFHNFNCFQNFK